MKPSEAALALPCYIAACLPVFLWGPPGISKSALANQAARAYSPNVIDIRASTLAPEDWHGIPGVTAEGRTAWNLPQFFPTDPDWCGTIIFDELNTAPPSMINSLLGFILDKRMGDYVLPAGARIIAAGNGEKDGCNVHRLSKAMGSRFAHIDIQPDLNDWTLYAAKAGFHLEVIAFNRFKPELHHAFDPRSDDHTFACPRTWEFVSDIVKQGPPPSIEQEMYAGCIGKGAAAMFTAFRRVFRNAPNLDGIILNPDSAPVPPDLGILHATCAGLAWKATQANFPSIARYVDRLDPEFGMYLVSAAQRRTSDPNHKGGDIAETVAFQTWAAKNEAFLNS